MDLPASAAWPAHPPSTQPVGPSAEWTSRKGPDLKILGDGNLVVEFLCPGPGGAVVAKVELATTVALGKFRQEPGLNEALEWNLEVAHGYSEARGEFAEADEAVRLMGDREHEFEPVGLSEGLARQSAKVRPFLVHSARL